MKFSVSEQITPESRRISRLGAIEQLARVDADWKRSYPWTHFKNWLHAKGLPLEIVRWINRNDYKPGAWWKRVMARVEAIHGKIILATHRLPADYDDLAHHPMNDLAAFVAQMKVDEDGEHRLGTFWFTEPGDHIVNREIVEPLTNPAYPSGAVGLRFDEDFFSFAVLPYKFRAMSAPLLVSILFPDTPHEKWDFLPDTDSPEMEEYNLQQVMKIDGFRLLADRNPQHMKACHNDILKIENGSVVLSFVDAKGFVFATDAATFDQIRAHVHRTRQ